MNKFHELAKKNGWWNDPDHGALLTLDERRQGIPEKLMLIVTEVAEAMEDYRNGLMDLQHIEYEGGMWIPPSVGSPKPVGFPSELADIVIRCYDLAGALNIDLNEVIEIKHKFNELRSYRHGGKKA
jgi:NTP pyrophosphatase (non-canonical NTP hydrolase)